MNIVATSDGYNGNSGLIRPNLLKPITRNKQQLAGSANVSYFTDPGGENYGGAVCDFTNPTSACVLQIAATQALITKPTTACPNPGLYNPSTAAVTNPCVTLTYTSLGTMQRNGATGPGFADLDLSGEKETKLIKGVSFILRADAFDILNHPNFGSAPDNVQSTTFGQITCHPLRHQ